MTDYATTLKLYDSYVDTFRTPDGRLPEMMQLKRTHTAFVVRNAEAIATGENFSPEAARLSRLAALLHDTGRYEQLRRYNMFKDSESIDHAVFSHDIVRERGWLAADDAEPILKAILYHNRRELPADETDVLTLCAAQTVRDADKLDIFRVLEERLANPAWKKDTRAFWNLSLTAAPNPEVVAAIEAERPVDYQAILSLSDFVLIQVGWMVSGLVFATSRRLCRDRAHLAFRRTFLKTLSSDPAIDRVCDLAETRLAEEQA